MRLSNLRDYRRVGTNALDWRFYATVDVTTGTLWWKKTEPRDISRNYGSCWFFVNDGRFTPGFQVENLVRAENARADTLALA